MLDDDILVDGVIELNRKASGLEHYEECSNTMHSFPSMPKILSFLPREEELDILQRLSHKSRTYAIGAKMLSTVE